MPVTGKGTHPGMVWEGPGLISGFLSKQEEMSKAEQSNARATVCPDTHRVIQQRAENLSS